MKKFRLLSMMVVCLMLVAAVISACAPAATPAPAKPTEAPPPTTAPAQPTEAPKSDRKVATFIWTQEFDNLSPLYTKLWFSSNTFQLWNCYAWNFDDQNKPVPVLVSEMPSVDNGGISADGKTLTFKLRNDLTWSDGTPGCGGGCPGATGWPSWRPARRRGPRALFRCRSRAIPSRWCWAQERGACCPPRNTGRRS